MSFAENQEQRRLRRQQFLSAESQSALRSVGEGPLAAAFAAVDQLRQRYEQMVNRDSEPIPADLLALAPDAVQARNQLDQVIHDLGGAAVLLGEPVRSVTSACQVSRNTVIRWSKPDAPARAAEHDVLSADSEEVDTDTDDDEVVEDGQH